MNPLHRSSSFPDCRDQIRGLLDHGLLGMRIMVADWMPPDQFLLLNDRQARDAIARGLVNEEDFR